jgi:hypothetical protein
MFIVPYGLETAAPCPDASIDRYQHLFINLKNVSMNSKQQNEVRKEAARNGAKDSAYGPHQILPNGDKVTVTGNRTQIGSQVYFGEKAAKDALDKQGKK